MTRSKMTSIQLRQVFVYILLVFNVFVIYLNISAVSKDKGATFIKNVQYFFDVRGKQLVESRNKTHNHQDASTLTGHFVWTQVKDMHRALPSFNKMRRVLSKIRDYMPLFTRRAAILHLDREMFKFKSVTNEGNVDKLKQLFEDVLLMNRPLSIGVLGGSQSCSPLCDKEGCHYHEVVVEWLRETLGVNVTLQNVALSFTTSSYYSWCFDTHLNVDDIDIIIWELATEDWSLQELFMHQRFTDPSQAQEEITRRLLSLRTNPYLIYFNFIGPQHIRDHDCLNSEQFAGLRLARHYNVTNISWGTAICSSLWRYGFTPDDLVDSGSTLGPIAHQQGALFLINFFLQILQKVTETAVQKAKSDEGYLRRMIGLYDIFQGNKSDAHKHIHNLTVVMVDGNIATRHSILSGTNTTSTIPKPRLVAPWLEIAECWPVSHPQYTKGREIQFRKNDGWEKSFSQREDWFTSTAENQMIKFPFLVTNKGNFSTVIAITTVVCEYCGQVLAFLDGNIEKSKLLSGNYKTHAFRVDELFFDLNPGNHTLYLKSLEEKPYKISAIMLGHQQRTKRPVVNKNLIF